MKICILIPTYNEEKTIKKVIEQIKRTSYNFIVMDDGSTDKTWNEIKKRTTTHQRLKGCVNNGRGHAIKYGASWAKTNEFTHVLIMDSDGQHLMSDIPIFLECLKNHPNTAIIIGNRLLNRLNMPLIRYYTNLFMSKVISLIIGQKVSDSQCGMKLVNLKAFKKLSLKCNRFDFDTELLLEVGKNKLEIKNVPIHTVYFKGRKSKINLLTDTIRFIKLLLRYYGK